MQCYLPFTSSDNSTSLINPKTKIKQNNCQCRTAMMILESSFLWWLFYNRAMSISCSSEIIDSMKSKVCLEQWVVLIQFPLYHSKLQPENLWKILEKFNPWDPGFTLATSVPKQLGFLQLLTKLLTTSLACCLCSWSSNLWKNFWQISTMNRQLYTSGWILWRQNVFILPKLWRNNLLRKWLLFCSPAEKRHTGYPPTSNDGNQ